jgi:hypothetical protein
MITEETYLEMVKLVALYESGDTDDTDWRNKPYLYTTTVETTGRYNLSYGDDIECKCGHPYYRHFDTYDNMDPCGCKYCGCSEFETKADRRDNIIDSLLK